MKNTLAIVFCLILVSCSDNDAHVEAELQDYFNRFENEAFARGVLVDLEDLDLSGYIENIESNGTIGQCTSFSDGSKEVVVDIRRWNSMSDLEREYVTFHELGHCVLERSHDNSSHVNGTCQSIMQSGSNDCRSLYTLTNRNEMLDELFE